MPKRITSTRRNRNKNKNQRRTKSRGIRKNTRKYRGGNGVGNKRNRHEYEGDDAADAASLQSPYNPIPYADNDGVVNGVPNNTMRIVSFENHSEDDEIEECGITFRPFHEGEKVTRTVCNHFFKSPELQQWLTSTGSTRTCPKCRTPLIPFDLQRRNAFTNIYDIARIDQANITRRNAENYGTRRPLRPPSRYL